jgi:hypothetical protein
MQTAISFTDHRAMSLLASHAPEPIILKLLSLLWENPLKSPKRGLCRISSKSAALGKITGNPII